MGQERCLSKIIDVAARHALGYAPALAYLVLMADECESTPAERVHNQSDSQLVQAGTNPEQLLGSLDATRVMHRPGGPSIAKSKEAMPTT
jgi:hypothetical protein